MSKDQNKTKLTIQFYHILLLSIILSPLLIFNSKFATRKREQAKLNIEADKKFERILYGRNLKESFEEGMNKICNRTSDDLKYYYSTGSLNKLDINSIELKINDGNEEQVNALIDIIKGYTGGESEKDVTENATTYAMKNIGIGVFLALTILSIPGWIFCCSCCCCNCCCCCCCKKAFCKLPFFIVTTVLYVLVFAICLFGLIKSNSIFTGLSNIECSTLKFCNEIIDGETKEDKPKWVGINGVINLLSGLITKINDLKEGTLTDFGDAKTSIETEKNTFEDILKEQSNSVITNENNKVEISSSGYRLDITTKNNYGLFRTDVNPHKAEPETSYIGKWHLEYSTIADNAKQYINDAHGDLESLKNDNSITSNLEDVKTSIEDIGKSIEDIQSQISNGIIQFSDYIDDYGKLGFKLFFLVLIVIDALIAILMFLFCFFSGKLCNKCCLCRCIFKCSLHFLWNILALLMIIAFLLGFLFTFIGIIGNDLISVLSYFISEDNLNAPNGQDPVLFGSEGQKLNKCFNGNGNIMNELGLETGKLDNLQELYDLKRDIADIRREFANVASQKIAYNRMIDALTERTSYSKHDFEIIKDNDENDTPNLYKLSELVNNLGDNLVKFSCNGETGCTYPKDIDSTFCNNYSDSKKSDCLIIEKINILVTNADTNDIDNSNVKSFKTSTERILVGYNNFLSAEDSALRVFETGIDNLLNVLNDYIGENGGLFDFVNCKFIGHNIEVILKNLKNTLGIDINAVGICLIIAGCSMAISICFTILLIVIINVSVDENKKNKTIPFAN